MQHYQDNLIMVSLPKCRNEMYLKCWNEICYKLTKKKDNLALKSIRNTIREKTLRNELKK